MIEVIGISKSYKDRIIFEDLNFNIARGQMVALVGPSGCGKTTLMNCLGHLEMIDKGRIKVFGQEINKRNRRKFFREKVGFLFQNFALIDNETVKYNLSLVSNNKNAIMDVLECLGIESLYQKYVYQLSGGEQQRVALARLMLKKPEIIFADEPTASLDRKNAELVMATLRNFQMEGTTIIVVTHDLSILEFFDEIIDFEKLKADVSVL